MPSDAIFDKYSMRINEDFLDSAEDLRDVVVQHESDVIERRRPELLIIFDLEQEMDMQILHKRLSKMLSAYPDVRDVQVLNWGAATSSGEYLNVYVPTENGEDKFRYNNFLNKYIVPIAVWTDGISMHTAYKMCLQFNNLNKTPDGKGLFGTVHIVRYDMPIPEGDNIFPGSINGLIRFTEGNTEIFNSSKRNPIRVAFADFVKSMSYLTDDHSLAYCWKYVIKKMDLMKVYVSADNKDRNETRKPETLRYIAPKTTELIRTLPVEFRDFIERIPERIIHFLTIEVREMKYEDFLDENLYSKSYRTITDAFMDETELQKTMQFSAVGVQRQRDEEHGGYFELGAIAAFEEKTLSVLVIKSMSVDAFVSAINILTKRSIKGDEYMQMMRRELISMLQNK